MAAGINSIGSEQSRQEAKVNRNQIKIVSSVKTKTLAFYLKNERDEWRLVSNSSPLSRKKYASAAIGDIADDIIRTIISDYNPRDRGVDIYFEGPEDDYLVLCKALESQKNIKCYIQKTMIAVAGKTGSGKTTLITEMGRIKGKNYLRSKADNVSIYTDEESRVVWNEIRGIDIGAENVLAARSTFQRLAKSGLTTFVYCLSTGKIDILEEDFIRFVKSQYPGMKVLIVLTRCVDDEGELFAEQLGKRIDNIKVIPVLAKKIKSRSGVIDAYGLENVDRYIFEGR